MRFQPHCGGGVNSTTPSILAECSVEIAATVEDSIESDLFAVDVKRDRDTPFKSDDAQSRHQVCAVQASVGKVREGEAIGLDTLDIVQRNRLAGTVSNIEIELYEVILLPARR